MTPSEPAAALPGIALTAPSQVATTNVPGGEGVQSPSAAVPSSFAGVPGSVAGVPGSDAGGQSSSGNCGGAALRFVSQVNCAPSNTSLVSPAASTGFTPPAATPSPSAPTPVVLPSVPTTSTQPQQTAPLLITPTTPPPSSAHSHRSSPSGSGQALTSSPTVLGTTVGSTAGLGGTIAGGTTSAGALSALLRPTLVRTASATTPRGRSHSIVGRQARTTPVTTSTPSRPSVIQRIEKVVPLGVWIALVAALAFGALSTGWAVMLGRRARRQAGQFAAVSEAALTDPLTGVLNRRGFTAATERELARARRYQRRFVVAYVDVRGLKRVNDSEGHLAGDRLLRETANLLRDSARADDVVGRIGGDELALLLAEQSAEGAIAVTRRISESVPARRAAMGFSVPWDLTIGIAAYPEDGDTFDDLLKAADRRLYEQRGIALR